MQSALLAPAVVISFDILSWFLACSGCAHVDLEVAQKPSSAIEEKLFEPLLKGSEFWLKNPQVWQLDDSGAWCIALHHRALDEEVGAQRDCWPLFWLDRHQEDSPC